MRKTLRKTLNLILAVVMIISMIPALGITAAASTTLSTATEPLYPSTGPMNLAYRGDEDNNPYGVIVTAPHVNAGSTANIVNGTLATGSGTGSTFNTWGTTLGRSNNPYYLYFSWEKPYEFTGLSVQWWIFTDTGVRWPTNVIVEYTMDAYPGIMTQLNGANTDQAEALAGLTWTEIGPVGVEHNANAPGSTWVRNTLWNNVVFDVPVAARHVRLRVVDKGTSGNTGFGINQINIYGTEFEPQTDEEKVDFTLDTLVFGDTSIQTANLPLLTEGPYGTSIAWSSSNTAFLWDDGTVLRPPSGSNVEVTLTGTVTLGDVSKTKTFTIGIPAYTETGRAIANVKTAPDGESFENGLDLEVPVRTAPKLPYRVWVEYTDGYAEWRSTQWPWQAASSPNNGPAFGPQGAPGAVAGIEHTWQTTALGGQYSVTGWITGDNATTWGYPITVNCTVVAGDFTMPQVNGIYRSTAIVTAVNNPASFAVPEGKVATTLPMSKVSLELSTQNRLTSNATRSVVQSATSTEWNVLTYLRNYRRSFGLDVTGYTPTPTGWESATTKLRGHGAGHFINALALAYASGAGSDQNRADILAKITRFLTETREIQEMSFYPLEWEGQAAGETYENVLARGQTWRDLEVTRWREARDTWPYDNTDKAASAPDWPLVNLDGVTSSWDDGVFNTDPKWFGYGYINATPPIHLVLNERYGTYSAWVWAPYYGVHKQLAGFMDCYYLLIDNEDPAVRALAELSYQICLDMSRWISDRLTAKAFIGETRADQINPKVPGTSVYGNLNRTWFENISGEYGGVNESIARCAAILDDDDPLKALLIAGAEMFYNKSYWDPLAANSEIMSLSSNSHANSRIPNFPGTLWTYTLNNDPYYYVVAKNFFDFNAGRYRYYGGNVGDGEWYRAPYTQIANIGTNSGQINETCCATNLAKLAKDLALFDPDNAEYIDYYERLMFNQLIGSVRQAGGSWGVTYQYAVGPNANKPFGNTNPGSTCCGGTGVENAVRYTDAVYFVSDDAIWVNMMVQTNAIWDAAGYTVSQQCTWPAETSTVVVTHNPGQTQIPVAMNIRVPWWATRDVSITVGGVEVADEYLPSSYVQIPARLWEDGAEVEISMPFQVSIDYAPDRSAGFWAGTIFLGPLAMTGTGGWSVQNINSDLSNIIVNEPVDFADSAANTPGNNRNVFTANVVGHQTNTNAAVLQPDYYRDTNATKYFRINMLAGGGVDRVSLFAMIQEARGLGGELYSAASFANLQEAIVETAGVYQNDASNQYAIDSQIAVLQAAIDALVPSAEGKIGLLELINNVLALKADQEAWIALYGEAFEAAWDAFMADPRNVSLANAARGYVEDPNGRPAAPFGYARTLAALEVAQAVYADAEATIAQVNTAQETLNFEFIAVRPGYMPESEDLPPLDALIAEANALNKSLYPLEKVAVLLQVIIEAEERVLAINAGSSTIHIADIPTAIAALEDAIEDLGPPEDNPSLLPFPWADQDVRINVGTGNFAMEGYGGASGIGGNIDLWSAWTGDNDHYLRWRLVPDANNEYIQIRRWQNNATMANSNSLAPTGGVVAAGTMLTLAASSATDDSQWWKFELQSTGRYVISNKANPDLIISPAETPASGVDIHLVARPATIAVNNTWRLTNLLTTSGGALEFPVVQPIASVDESTGITAPVGTAIDELALPTIATVRYTDNSRRLRAITWNTAAYNGNVAGEYTLTGTVALDGIETNPNNITARITITVEGDGPGLANYGAVNAAIAAAEAIVREEYTLESLEVLDKAIEAVIWDLDATQQATVDDFAAAINAAYEALVEWADIDYLRINLAAITRVARNAPYGPVGITVNNDANPAEAAKIVLSTSNQAMATIGPDGRTVITGTRAGTVTLTATYTQDNITLRHSVTLMIT